MPHLRRYPLGRFSRHQHHRSVGVAHLVWVAVTDLDLLQNSCPHPFADHQVSGPPFACAGVLKDLFAFQIGVCFLVLQSDQRRGQKLYVSDAGIGLGCFGFLGGLSQHLVDPELVAALLPHLWQTINFILLVRFRDSYGRAGNDSCC